jgi:hypothetical protein
MHGPSLAQPSAGHSKHISGRDAARVALQVRPISHSVWAVQTEQLPELLADSEERARP